MGSDDLGAIKVVPNIPAGRARERPESGCARLSANSLARPRELVKPHTIRYLSIFLRAIARELVETVRGNVTIDWTLRENVRANLRRLVKRILRRHGLI